MKHARQPNHRQPELIAGPPNITACDLAKEGRGGSQGLAGEYQSEKRNIAWGGGTRLFNYVSNVSHSSRSCLPLRSFEGGRAAHEGETLEGPVGVLKTSNSFEICKNLFL